MVSIPRSGFCSFKPDIRARRVPMQYGFNPSVGILFIQADALPEDFGFMKWVSIPRSGFCSFKQCSMPTGTRSTTRFQSLGRDSVHSSCWPACLGASPAWFQSLGRDSVHSSPAWPPVFAPIEMFQSLGRDSVHSSSATAWAAPGGPGVSIPRSGFCSFKRGSLGGGIRVYVVFQSLGRDSVHSSDILRRHPGLKKMVSIPRSGFCSFKLSKRLRTTNE